MMIVKVKIKKNWKFVSLPLTRKCFFSNNYKISNHFETDKIANCSELIEHKYSFYTTSVLELNSNSFIFILIFYFYNTQESLFYVHRKYSDILIIYVHSFRRNKCYSILIFIFKNVLMIITHCTIVLSLQSTDFLF
jgi:hypothetical protein